MVRFGDDAEKVTCAKAGDYLFRIYEVNEKQSQAGNDYWQIKFETKEGLKVCDNFMFNGKAASKTLFLLTGLGLADGENFPDEDIEKEDILGKFLYINVVKDKDSNFLKCPFNSSDYRVYESKKSKPVKKQQVVEDEQCPF